MDPIAASSVESLRILLDTRRNNSDWSLEHELLASVALTLAEEIDDPSDTKSLAGLVKQYMAVVAEIAKESDAEQSLDGLADQMSSEMGD